MRFTEVENLSDLREFMTTPTRGLVECLGRLDGDIIVLGAGGKMGPELVETLVKANREAGRERRIGAASRFSNPEVGKRLLELGVELHFGDLRMQEFLDGLPDCRNVVFMPGMKFGSSGDWTSAFHQNSILPYLVGERYTSSRIVVFSSGNPYPRTPVEEGGCGEDDELKPRGVYGWNVVARESSFRITSERHEEQTTGLYRLFYSQHLCYGVLVDLARMVQEGEEISLSMPAVNLISQRDAIDVALKLLEHCENPPFVLNAAGEIVRVREIAEKMGQIMNREPRLVEPEPETALLGKDERCRELFGDYRDTTGEMIEAAARWVMRGNETWDMPTMFGKVDHLY